MDFSEGMLLINKAFEKREENKAWQMWLMIFQHMDKKSFVPFSKFKQQLIKPQFTNNKTDEELIEMAENIRKADQKIT